MANAKLTDNDKIRLKEDLLTGSKSMRELAKIYNVSPSAIQKYKNSLDSESVQIVNAGVAYKMGLSQIEDPKMVNAIVNAVDDKTKHLLFFQNSAIKGQQKANEMLDFVDDMKDLLAYANLTKTNKETVLGKDPETVINNANVQQDNTPMQITIVRDV